MYDNCIFKTFFLIFHQTWWWWTKFIPKRSYNITQDIDCIDSIKIIFLFFFVSSFNSIRLLLWWWWRWWWWWLAKNPHQTFQFLSIWLLRRKKNNEHQLFSLGDCKKYVIIKIWPSYLYSYQANYDQKKTIDSI